METRQTSRCVTSKPEETLGSSMLRSISVNLNYLWNKFLGTRFLQLEIYKRVVTALLDPLGGGHPWLGWVLGSRAGGQLGTPVGGGRTTQPQEIIRGIP